MNERGSLLIVTGPPGAGKSTVSRLLANRMERSVLVEGDLFFAFLASGAIPPWLPESRAQNEIVGDAAADATKRFMADYATVYAGVMGPWQLDRFTDRLGTRDLDYVIVLPSVDVSVDRVKSRTDHEFADLDATRKMHAAFAESIAADQIDERHIVDGNLPTPTAVADAVTRRRSAGSLRLR